MECPECEYEFETMRASCPRCGAELGCRAATCAECDACSGTVEQLWRKLTDRQP